MIKEMIVSPEELFFLGKSMKAKYCDYDYIAMMKDISQNRAAAEADANRSLSEKGYVQEDFSGNVSLSEEILPLLNPVFFGEFEASASVYQSGNTQPEKTARIHRDEKSSTLCVQQGDGLHFSILTDEKMDDILDGMLPAGYSGKKQEELKAELGKVDRVLALKNNYVGERAEIRIYLESEGTIFFESRQDVKAVSADAFCSEARRILRGEE